MKLPKPSFLKREPETVGAYFYRLIDAFVFLSATVGSLALCLHFWIAGGLQAFASELVAGNFDLIEKQVGPAISLIIFVKGLMWALLIVVLVLTIMAAFAVFLFWLVARYLAAAGLLLASTFKIEGMMVVSGAAIFIFARAIAIMAE